MIGAYIGDIPKYDYGIIEKRGDDVRLVNYEYFDANGQNRKVSPNLVIKNRDKGVVYAIVNKKNGFRYIGQAMNFGRRRADHKRMLRRGTDHHSELLQKEWNEFGEASFSFEIIEECELEKLRLREDLAIRTLRPEYNSQSYSRRSRKSPKAIP